MDRRRKVAKTSTREVPLLLDVSYTPVKGPPDNHGQSVVVMKPHQQQNEEQRVVRLQGGNHLVCGEVRMEAKGLVDQMTKILPMTLPMTFPMTVKNIVLTILEFSVGLKCMLML